jgi:hypothetical protein
MEMRITRKSVISGVERTRDIPVNPEDYIIWEKGYANVQDVMPYLSDADREFILSGITAGEWEKMLSHCDAE